MNKTILSTLETVRKFHPEVTMVIFNKQGQWNYCDDNFNSPTFDDRIDVSILEKASDSVDILPCVFQLDIEE